ncbi:ABC transporter ATP-binding protein [Anaerococcus sp. ENR1011]|uniref:ABC transporter ATP-binding protein n=1 Tax=Anaerococcus groningensis TaxID=3115616 RepID=A0ABW9MYJ5_9FIRM
MKHIELNNISKSYGNRKIIDNLSFFIEEKEIVAIVGKSGSGKSTILNMIGLLETYDDGEILLKGKRLPDLNSKQSTLLRRNEINYLFQTNALISEKTVRENLLLAMEYVDIKDEEKFKKISEILDRLDILDIKDQKANTVSGGEAQRVALARCILKPGDLILADEPTGSLDPKMSNEVFSLLLRLRNDYNKTILIVTHDMDMAKKCDRAIDINK